MGALVLYACYGSGNIFWLIIAWSTQKRLDPRLAKGRGFFVVCWSWRSSLNEARICADGNVLNYCSFYFDNHLYDPTYGVSKVQTVLF